MKMLYLYKEFGIENGKSIMDDFSENAHPEKDRIINYLKNGRGTVAAPGYYTDVFTGKTVHITKAILTDGEYSWPSIFPYYVEKYNLLHQVFGVVFTSCGGSLFSALVMKYNSEKLDYYEGWN